MYVFFQAEDGIRDSSVTGVQTCALPISYTHPHTHTCTHTYTHMNRGCARTHTYEQSLITHTHTHTESGSGFRLLIWVIYYMIKMSHVHMHHLGYLLHHTAQDRTI